MKFLITFLLISSTFLTYSQQVKIYGTNKSYAGDELVFYKYEDRLSFKTKELSTAKVDTSGYFEFFIEINETQQAYVFLYVYKGYIYLEPNKEYEIMLPKKKQKTNKELLNPFFNEQSFTLRILNSEENELNTAIKVFDYFYNLATIKILDNKYKSQYKILVDSNITYLDTIFSELENEYFTNHKKYRYANLRYTTYFRKNNLFIEKYFMQQPVLYENTAYMSLFSEVFKNIFVYESDVVNLDFIYDAIRRRDFNLLKSVMMRNEYFKNEAFTELVILKGLYELFYKNPSSELAVIKIFETMKTNASNEQNKLIASNLLEIITKLRINNPAPKFELPNKKDKLVELEKYRKDFVYLNFYNPDSYACQQEIILLQKLYDEKHDNLKIVTIFISEDIEEMKEFLKNNKAYKWDFLHCKMESQVLKDYEISVYPTYFLINPDGKLTLDSGLSPNDNFRELYKAEQKKWDKNSATKNNTILGP